jgi:hypothetical protein
MKKQLTFAIAFFFLLVFFVQNVNAETFKQGDAIDLKVSCSNVNCSNAQNITIVSPTTQTLVSNKQMSLTNGFLNISFNQTQTLGQYNYFLYDSFGGYYDGSFLITPSGTNPTTAQGLIYALLILASMFFLIVCLYGAFTIDGKNEFTMGGDLIKVNFNKYYKGFLFLVAYLFAIFTSYLTWQVSAQFLMLDLGTSIFKFVFNMLWIGFFPIMILLIIVGFVKWLADVELHKLAERGLKPR